MHKEFNDRNAEGFSLNDFAKPPMTPATPKPRAGEVCDVCGGRKSACDVLGHRQPGDKTEWQQKPRAGEHTKGPWKAVADTVHTLAGAQIADCSFAVKAEANTRRIVACVNYCEGTATEQLESSTIGHQALQAERDSLRERGRELVEALRECTDDLEAELEGRWRSTKDHPAMQARYKRDMEPVKDARTILAKHGR